MSCMCYVLCFDIICRTGGCSMGWVAVTHGEPFVQAYDPFGMCKFPLIVHVLIAKLCLGDR